MAMDSARQANVGIFYKNDRGAHCFEIALSHSLKGRPARGLLLVDSHPLGKIPASNRGVLWRHLKKNPAPLRLPNGAVRAGYETYHVVKGGNGETIAYADDYQPKMFLPRDGKTRGLGARFSKWCIDYLENLGVTHIATPRGVKRLFEKNPELMKSNRMTLQGLNITPEFEGQLAGRGMNPDAVIPIGEFKKGLLRKRRFG